MTEFEKLTSAADLLRQVTHGRLEMRPSAVGHVYIHPADDAYISMDMTGRYEATQNQKGITFQAHVRRMGVPMDAAGLMALQKEIHEAFVLLKEFEMMEFHPTQEDMMALREHLIQEQQEAQQQNTGPVMG